MVLWAIPKWNKGVYSIKSIQWYRLQNHRSIYIEWQPVTIEWGVNGEREGGREKELQISRVGDRVLDRNGYGEDWKWPLVKKDTWVFLAKQINRINRLSIKMDKSWVVLKFFHFIGDSTFILMMMNFTTIVTVINKNTFKPNCTHHTLQELKDVLGTLSSKFVVKYQL